MNLFEHEGKALLSRFGLRIPRSFLVRRDAPAAAEDVREAAGPGPYMIKAQVLSTDRAARGGVLGCRTAEAALLTARTLAAEAVLVEEVIPVVRESYVACVHDSGARGPALLFAAEGGSGVETSRGVLRFPLDALDPTSLPEACRSALADVSPALVPFCRSVIEAFWSSDARQIEINPVALLEDGTLAVLDAKIALDDAAAFRHPEWQARSSASARTDAAKTIDAGAHWYQGTAGTYLEMDGDVAILLSGGGASVAIMDEMELQGLRPANYTEYSGNPPREKVRDLARVVLSKPGLRGLLVAGAIANFTDIKETFAGIVDALEEGRPAFPIVVRRAGPNDAEGMELMRDCAGRNGLDVTLRGKETPLRDAVAELKGLMDAYGDPS